MLNSGRGLTTAHALTTALVTGALVWMGLALWQRGGHALPVAGWLDLALLAVLSFVVLALGWQIRRYLRASAAGRPMSRTPSPQFARSVLATAQASVLAGGLFTGVHAATALRLVPDADVPSVRGDLLLTLALVVASVVLAGVGLLVQSWCRIEPGDDDDEGRGGPGSRVTTGLYARDGG